MVKHTVTVFGRDSRCKDADTFKKLQRERTIKHHQYIGFEPRDRILGYR